MKWFTIVWYEKDSLVNTENSTLVQKALYGPFEFTEQREEAIAALIEEHEKYLLGVVRFDINSENVPEIVE